MGANFALTFLRKRPPRRYLATYRSDVWRPTRIVRLGWDLGRKVKQDHADLLHVQYTAPLTCSVPVVVSVHDVSFLEHPEYFTRHGPPSSLTVGRTVRSAAQDTHVQRILPRSILKVYGDIEEDKVVVVPNAAASRFRPISREAATATYATA